MPNQLYRVISLLIITCALLFNSSCEKLTENPDVANALVGQWRFSNTLVNLSIGGVELTHYLTSNFDYTQDEAEATSDSIIADVKQNYQGTFVFNGDNTFKLNIDSQEEKEGSWLVRPDGKILTLKYFSTDQDSVTIQTITAQTLALKIPPTHEDADFDHDGENESVLEINTETELSKSSNGGAGG